MPEPSQLLMHRSLLVPLPEPAPLPEGYTLRILSGKEEAPFTEVLADAFPEFGWTVEKAREELTDAPDVEAIYVVDFLQRPVATASVRYLPDRFPNEGIVHWVAVSSRHRGRALGLQVVHRVCMHFIEDGYEATVLETDDFRLPAIKTYWKLGFRPLIRDESHRARWNAILPALGEPAI